MAQASFSCTGPAGQVLTFRQALTEVAYLSDLDRNWRWTDRAGHDHWCDYEAGDYYPTLRAVYDENHWCSQCDGDYQPLDHYECPLCGEVITPGTTGPGTVMVPGLREWELTETLTGDVARAAVEAGDWVSIESGSGGVRVTRVTYPGDSEAAALLQAWREQQA